MFVICSCIFVCICICMSALVSLGHRHPLQTHAAALNPSMLPDPARCHSHLVARIQVAPLAAPTAAAAANGSTVPADPATTAGTTAAGATADQMPVSQTDFAPANTPAAAPDATAAAGDAGAASGRRMLLGATSAKAAAAATATTAAAGAAQVSAAPTSPQFDDSKLPQHPLALNKVLSAADIATARALIAQVGSCVCKACYLS